MYVKIESERLNYIRFHQKELRTEEYVHLQDAIAKDGNIGPHELGKLVILPSGYIGSPRHMHEYMQDAMTYVRNFGNADLFITFTCNPQWEEVKAHMLSGQTAADRPDLIARVFMQKLTKFKNVITKSHIFGQHRCWLHTIEYQKRGLPHAHCLVWLKEKLRPTDIDKVISAELPDPEKDPLLFDVITKNMVHGPCGILNRNSPCMVNGRCSKRFPKNLIKETQMGDDGYPTYRRRKPGEGGFSANIKIKHGTEVVIDNRWIVPYSPLLSKMFQAHINVESCHSVKSIKYICKYVHKGSDQVIFGLEGVGASHDEVTNFQLGRYVSSSEAVWRILGFKIHERSITVVKLAVHLENGQRVYFTRGNLQQRLQDPPRTTLTAFFELCRQDSFAKRIIYCDVPRFYTWDHSKKIFQRRKQGEEVRKCPGVFSADALARVYTVHPSNEECFFLRMLLHEVTGPTSFAALRMYEGMVCETYREACIRRGLLEDDRHWDATLEEAMATQSAARLRHLFCILLTTCSLSNPLQMWEKYKESLSEDILLRFRAENPDIHTINFSQDIFNRALIILDDLCFSMVGRGVKKHGLPSPQRQQRGFNFSEVLRELNFDVQALESYLATNEPRLVPDQQRAFTEIWNLVQEKKGSIIFLDAPGGTGKTFVTGLLLAKVRQQKEIALAVASSGIAATLLEGGRTAHSAFKLPLNLTHEEWPVCNVAKGSGVAKVLEKCRLIVWDECTMSHKKALEAVDRTLQDLRGNKSPMGGVVVVLAGDF